MDCCRVLVNEELYLAFFQRLMTRVFSPKLLPLKPISETNSPSLGEAPRHLPIRRLLFRVAELDGLVSGERIACFSRSCAAFGRVVSLQPPALPHPPCGILVLRVA